MNLYFRLFWLLFWRMRRARTIDFLDVSRLEFRAWPTDCDINLHLTNARYPALMDLARTYMLSEMGLLKPFLQRKWLPVVNASEFTFIRDIKPLHKFNIDTRLLGWDDKYFYIEQRFVSQRGLHAIANVRGLFVCKGRKITTAELLQAAAFQGEAPALAADVLAWKQLLQAKKQQNQ
ncbi:thioesterase family protein [Shewanella yunxiaonensis]|uniref:Thioesterase family protein n=1 Tax=Shewanella yunxiaonensis TaxID=2829809 RepID=A0ABX7YU15_9GAMM|nr:thioesterase family protein [Shewanella yunxiaonensis]QUN05836.1 thioesterase family protein [Shewanella yunxiaonensis]